MYKKGKVKVKIHYFRVGMALFLLVLVIWGVSSVISSLVKREDKQSAKLMNSSSSILDSSSPDNTDIEPVEPLPAVFYPILTENTSEFYPDLLTSATEPTLNSSEEQQRLNNSLYAIIIDTETNEIVAQHDYNVKMYPASLTKVMTLIVVMDYINNRDISALDERVTIKDNMVTPMIQAQASRAGFVVGETPTVRDLIYGLILPSGADAAIALAEYVAGSEAAFVRLMNEKAAEIGLKYTHFQNPVGLHSEQNYSTAEEMAMLLNYAIQDDFCKQVLSTYQYTVPPSAQNPEGIVLTSTMFGRMKGDEMPGVVVKGGKTGFTSEAGQCLASFAEINGKTYIMVLAGGISKWKTIYETLSGYSVFCYGGEEYIPPA